MVKDEGDGSDHGASVDGDSGVISAVWSGGGASDTEVLVTSVSFRRSLLAR